jgi:hypothetical protein
MLFRVFAFLLFNKLFAGRNTCHAQAAIIRYASVKCITTTMSSFENLVGAISRQYGVPGTGDKLSPMSMLLHPLLHDMFSLSEFDIDTDNEIHAILHI